MTTEVLELNVNKLFKIPKFMWEDKKMVQDIEFLISKWAALRTLMILHYGDVAEDNISISLMWSSMNPRRNIMVG